MFLTDHLVDDRTTRVADVAALEMFVARGRAFVVAGGTDAGLTVLERVASVSIQDSQVERIVIQ